MIDPTIIFVIISMMFMLALFLIGVIYSRLHWATKAFFIVFSLAVVAMDYKVLTESLGWPVRDVLPDEFRLLGAEIREPNPNDREGAIYVWYLTPDSEGKPRNVRTAYTKEMHKMMAKAQAMLANGQQVHMSRFKKGQGTPGAGQPGVEGDAGAKRRGQSNFQSPGPLDFVPPPDDAPVKG